MTTTKNITITLGYFGDWIVTITRHNPEAIKPWQVRQYSFKVEADARRFFSSIL
jgi:hypothetical protein